MQDHLQHHPITSIDDHGGSVATQHRMYYHAPVRVWERTEAGGWTSRDWLRGEKAAYERAVLGW